MPIWLRPCKRCGQVLRSSTIEYEFHKSGDLKSLTVWTRLKPVAPTGNRSWGDGQAGREYNATTARIAALRNATQTLDGYTEMSPRGKAETVLKIATKYEKYTVDGLDNAGWETLSDDVFRKRGEEGSSPAML